MIHPVSLQAGRRPGPRVFARIAERIPWIARTPAPDIQSAQNKGKKISAHRRLGTFARIVGPFGEALRCEATPLKTQLSGDAVGGTVFSAVSDVADIERSERHFPFAIRRSIPDAKCRGIKSIRQCIHSVRTAPRVRPSMNVFVCVDGVPIFHSGSHSSRFSHSDAPDASQMINSSSMAVPTSRLWGTRSTPALCRPASL